MSSSIVPIKTRTELGLQKRKPNRLQGFDYSKFGYYFITLLTKGKRCWFGRVVDGQVRLNEVGLVVERRLLWLESRKMIGQKKEIN